MSDNRVNILRLRMQIDGERNLAEAGRLVEDIRQELSDLARTEQLNTRISAAFDQAMKKQNATLRTTADVYDEAAKAAQRYDNAADDASRTRSLETGRQAIGDFSTTFGAASSALGGVGVLSGVGDVLGFVEYIPLAVQGLTALNPVMLALTGIVAGVTLGITALNAEQEAQKKKVEETAEALEREATARRGLLAAISTGDPGALQVRRAELRAEINTVRQEQLNPLLSQQNDLRLRALDAARSTFPQLDPNSDQIRTFAANAAASMAEGRALQEQIDAVNAALAPLNDQLGDLEEFGANGARILQGVNAPLKDLQSMSGLQNLTTKDLRERQSGAMATVNAYAQAITAAEEQIQIARRDGNSVLVDALEIEQARLSVGFDTAQAELELLNTRGAAIAAVNDAIEAEKKRNAALTVQTENYFAALENTTKAQEALFSLQERADSEYQKFIADSVKISTDAQERFNEIAAEGGEARAKIVERTEESIAKIQRDSGRNLFNAVAERDALAAYLEAQKADDQLTDARKAQDEQIKEQEKGQEKQLRSLQSSVSKQVAALDASYRTQQQITASAQSRAMTDLMNAKNAETQIALYGSNGVRTIMSNMWGQLTIETVNGVNAILTATRQLVGGFGGTQMYVNGVNAGSPAAYDLVGLPPPQTTAVNRAVDQRLSTYFNVAGYSRG